MKVPILMITYNRLSYTKKALAALLKCEGATPIIVDNGSDDGTVEELYKIHLAFGVTVISNKINIGIAGAMNDFLKLTKLYEFVGKVDNDTIVPPDFIERMLPHMQRADLVQAKHQLIAASGVGTFDEWVSKMPGTGSLKFNHFIGGSGILCRRSVLSELPVTENKLMAWREWQKQNPFLKKAFATDVEIELLDEKGYEDYPEYYKQTGRV